MALLPLDFSVFLSSFSFSLTIFQSASSMPFLVFQSSTSFLYFQRASLYSFSRASFFFSSMVSHSFLTLETRSSSPAQWRRRSPRKAKYALRGFLGSVLSRAVLMWLICYKINLNQDSSAKGILNPRANQNLVINHVDIHIEEDDNLIDYERIVSYFGCLLIDYLTEALFQEGTHRSILFLQLCIHLWFFVLFRQLCQNHRSVLSYPLAQLTDQCLLQLSIWTQWTFSLRSVKSNSFIIRLFLPLFLFALLIQGLLWHCEEGAELFLPLLQLYSVFQHLGNIFSFHILPDEWVQTMPALFEKDVPVFKTSKFSHFLYAKLKIGIKRLFGLALLSFLQNFHLIIVKGSKI